MNLYFVGAGSAVVQARALARRSGLSGDRVVTDSRDVMGSAYRAAGLTAVLVDSGGAVRSVRRDLGPAVQLETSMRALARPTPEGLDDPGRHHAAGRSGRAAARLTRCGAAALSAPAPPAATYPGR